MSEKVYFISDIHLHLQSSEVEEEKKRYLFEFLDKVKKEQARLYVVGDLFDFWFEYKHVIPRHFFRVLRKLQEMVDSGCEIHILGGNHDYWMENFISDEIGIRIHPSPLAVKIGDKAFFITHADGILKKDRGYRLMRKILRNPFFIRLFRFLHPDLGFAIAEKISGKSRHFAMRNRSIEEEERLELIEYGKTKLKESFDFVVTAHFHLPTVYSENNKKIINLGDWMKYFTFGLFDGQDLHLCYWKR